MVDAYIEIVAEFHSSRSKNLLNIFKMSLLKFKIFSEYKQKFSKFHHFPANSINTQTENNFKSFSLLIQTPKALITNFMVRKKMT